MTSPKSTKSTSASESTTPKTRNPWVAYVVWRVLFFVIPFAVLFPLALSTNMDMFLAGLISALIASLLALALSYLLLSGRRQAVADQLATARANKGAKSRDESIEDDAVDAAN